MGFPPPGPPIFIGLAAERYFVYSPDNQSTFRTLNNRTGAIEYAGSDGTTAIQTAMDAMIVPDSAGLLGGVCSVLGQIMIDQAQGPTIYSGCILAGGGQSTDQPTGVGTGQHQGDCLVPTANCTGPVVTLTGNPNQTISEAFPVIRDLTISGSTTTSGGGTGQHGIVVDDSGVVAPATTLLDARIWSVSVFNVGGWGVYLNTAAKTAIGGNFYLERCAQGAVEATNKSGIAPALWIGAGSIGNISACGQGSRYAIDCDGASTVRIKGLRFTTNPGGGVNMLHMTGEAASIADSAFLNNGGPTIPQVNLARASGTTLVDPGVVGCEFYDSRAAGSCAKNHVGIDNGNIGQAVAGFVDACRFTTLANGHPAIGGGNGSNKPYSTSTFTVGFNHGYNDKVGALTNFFDTSNVGLATPHGATISDSSGTTAVPVAAGATIGLNVFSGDYVNFGSAKEITVSGGVGVSITITDPAGNATAWSPVAALTAYILRPHWTINFGAFTVAPTVSCIVV